MDQGIEDRQTDDRLLGLRRQRLLDRHHDGEKYYQADGGDFICVSNFPTALLDLPIASTQTNDSLLFTAATDASRRWAPKSAWS